VTTIAKIVAREVLDSRGSPTVEAEVHTRDGALGRAIVPSGASTAAAEACELRDTTSPRFDGRGVRVAVAHVRERIAPAVIGLDAADQVGLDRKLLELDDSPRKTKLGGNALLAVSLAAAHAAAVAGRMPLYRHLHSVYQQIDPAAPPPRIPVPMVNMISGGLHAGGNLDFQDILIVPRAASDIAAALDETVRIYRRLGRLLSNAGYEGRLVGDEGGYGPRLRNNPQAIEFVLEAIEAAGLRPRDDVSLALDVAATHFFDGSQYRLSATGEGQLTSSQLVDYLASLAQRFPITSIEDPLAEEDWSAWREITARLGARVQLVGDDLFATNLRRLARGIELGAANSVLVKINQIGTLTETFELIALARRSGYGCIVSARSGETEDTTIADLAVATAADHIKIGSVTRSERLAKYNQLLRIAENL
jgi:enolase